MNTEWEVLLLKSQMSERDILKSSDLSVFDIYFEGNSEAYGNLQNESSILGYPDSYFIGNA